MIIIKSKHEIQLMRESGKVTGWILNELSNVIKPGISTFEIDSFIEKSITGAGMQPTFKGYQGYPASACVSVNEEVVHGIPDKKRILQEGDIVSVDIGATHKGYVSDCARTYGVGQISDEMQRLIDSAKKGFYEGIKYCKPGQRLSDIGHAIQKSVEADGYGVVRNSELRKGGQRSETARGYDFCHRTHDYPRDSSRRDIERRLDSSDSGQKTGGTL